MKWEYLVVTVPRNNDESVLIFVNECLRLRGEQGWELASHYMDVLIFKRPKKEIQDVLPSNNSAKSTSNSVNAIANDGAMYPMPRGVVPKNA